MKDSVTLEVDHDAIAKDCMVQVAFYARVAGRPENKGHEDRYRVELCDKDGNPTNEYVNIMPEMVVALA